MGLKKVSVTVSILLREIHLHEKINMSEADKIHALQLHIKNVQTNCETIARQLITDGRVEAAKELLINAQVHDLSKWSGIEWENLVSTPLSEQGLKLAIRQHTLTNKHHAEYYRKGIAEMDDVHLAELVADWVARSQEMGTDIRGYIDKDATKKYKFSKTSRIYKKIMKYLDMLVSKPFEPITPA